MTINTVAARALPTKARVDKLLSIGRRFLAHQSPPHPAVAGVVGTHVLAGETSSPREIQDALTPVAAKSTLVPRDRPSPPPGTSVPAGRGGSGLVDEDNPPTRRETFQDSGSGPPPCTRTHLDRGGELTPLTSQWSQEEASLHINLLEIKALFLALQAFKDLVTDHRVTSICDNSTVVAYVNKQGGPVSHALCSLTGRLLQWSEANRAQLKARYLPGQSNILADLLSRRNQVLGAEWSLHPKVARKLLRVWGSPTLDLFATHLNAKLLLYCSLIPDPQALFKEAFRRPWNDLDTYEFPLFHLVERVVARVRETLNLSMTLVANFWLEKEWFADLLLLLTKPPLALPLWENPPHDCTSHNGSPSVVGVVQGASLQSTPLYLLLWTFSFTCVETRASPYRLSRVTEQPSARSYP